MRTAKQHISIHNYAGGAAPLQAVSLPLKWYLMYIGVIFQCLTLNILQMFRVHMHAGALRMLLNGCVYVWDIIHSLKLVDYLPLHTHRPYNNLNLNHTCNKINGRRYNEFQFTIKSLI